MVHIFPLKLRERIKYDKSYTNNMPLIFYDTMRDERQEKDEQKTPSTDHMLKFHRLRTSQKEVHLNFRTT